jgi:hypothetical protein
LTAGRNCTTQGEGTKDCGTLAWAHPEYGNVIAAGSNDAAKEGGRVYVWEEVTPTASGKCNHQGMQRKALY